MAKFVKNPITVEAVRFFGHNFDEIESFLGPGRGTWYEFFVTQADSGDPAYVEIRTLEGTMQAQSGDWIIREPSPTEDRKFYPCKPDIFEHTYAPVD